MAPVTILALSALSAAGCLEGGDPGAEFLDLGPTNPGVGLPPGDTPGDVLEGILAWVAENLTEAQQRVSVLDWDEANARIAKARSLEILGQSYLSAHRDDLDAADARVYEVRLELGVWSLDLAGGSLGLAQRMEELAGALDAATEEEALVILYSLEAALPSSDEVIADFHEFMAHVDLLLLDEPQVAERAGLDWGDVDTLRVAVDQLYAARDQMNEGVAEVRERLVDRYKPEDDRLLPTSGNVAGLPSDVVPPELGAFFVGFDATGDGVLSVREAKDFFYWLEGEVAYRYDDEDATDTLPGTRVGDGRPGAGYLQTPMETFEERAGDCEDTTRWRRRSTRFGTWKRSWRP